MRVVTKILILSKVRSKIYIDEQFAFVLYKGELRMYHVKEGQEITEEDYQEIMTKVLPKRAKLRSMNLLKNREYTREQLRRKLEQGFYPKEAAEEALAYVESYGYIDDRRYAEEYIRCSVGARSRQRIRTDLYRKGIAKDIIEEQLEAFGDENMPDETKMARKLLEKRHFNPETADIRERQRTYAYLCRKGFENDAIRQAMKLLDIT